VLPSANDFDLLGARPSMGRTFTPEDERQQAAMFLAAMLVAGGLPAWRVRVDPVANLRDG
jgi:hypothetical protein